MNIQLTLSIKMYRYLYCTSVFIKIYNSVVINPLTVQWIAKSAEFLLLEVIEF